MDPAKEPAFTYHLVGGGGGAEFTLFDKALKNSNDLALSHRQFIGSQFSLVPQLYSLSEDKSLSVSPKDRVILCPPQAINDTRFLIIVL